MYNSQYYTCEQIDQRLLQGYLDDYNQQNNTNLTKEEFLELIYNKLQNEKYLSVKYTQNLTEAEKKKARFNLGIGVFKDEQVVISCSTDVEGISMTGLVINVFYDGSTTEAEQYTTDENGMATFRVFSGRTYRVVFPDVSGLVTPAPETHTASISQRSIEVTYEAVPAPPVEVFTITFFLVRENTVYSLYQGQIVVTKGGRSTTYTAGTDGTINVEIPIGTAYTVDVVKPEGLHIKEGTYHWEFVAESSIRAKVITFYEYHDGILLTDAAGNDYTFEQFKDKVDQGVLSKGDAKYIHLCTNALLTHAVVEGTDSTCYVSIYEIGKRKYHDTDDKFADISWCNSRVIFYSIPNNTYQYDGKYRTAQIIAEGVERNLTTPAATRLSSMSYTFTNSEGTAVSGFLASRGQLSALMNNLMYIDEMLDYVYDEEEHYTLASLNPIKKWSSDQPYNESAFYHWNGDFMQTAKINGCIAVPFYA